MPPTLQLSGTLYFWESINYLSVTWPLVCSWVVLFTSENQTTISVWHGPLVCSWVVLFTSENQTTISVWHGPLVCSWVVLFTSENQSTISVWHGPLSAAEWYSLLLRIKQLSQCDMAPSLQLSGTLYFWESNNYLSVTCPLVYSWVVLFTSENQTTISVWHGP